MKNGQNSQNHRSRRKEMIKQGSKCVRWLLIDELSQMKPIKSPAILFYTI